MVPEVWAVKTGCKQQCWQKAGISPSDLRFVALEGGGEVLTSLLGQHIQVGVGNISEVSSYLESGDIRVLAVLLTSG